MYFEQGTSADQDTRFSNKMKKLLKSQKFAPELDIAVSVHNVGACFIHILNTVQIVCLFGISALCYCEMW